MKKSNKDRSAHEAAELAQKELQKNDIKQMACTDTEELKRLQEEHEILIQKNLALFFAGKQVRSCTPDNIHGNTFNLKDVSYGIKEARRLLKDGNVTEKRQAQLYIDCWGFLVEMIESRTNKEGIEFCILGGLPKNEQV